jgi:hypothetical protein
MRGDASALPPAFSLLRSEFNEFLFAPIGEEGNHTLLTVLSALARLGLDPWQESARLALLSREKAVQSLASMIAGLPNGRWAQSESAAIASRLVALLPAKGAASPPRPAAAGKYPAPPQIARFVLMAILGGAMFFALTHWNTATVAPDKPPASTESGAGN